MGNIILDLLGGPIEGIVISNMYVYLLCHDIEVIEQCPWQSVWYHDCSIPHIYISLGLRSKMDKNPRYCFDVRVHPLWLDIIMKSLNRIAVIMNTVFAQRLQYLYSVLALGNLFPKPTINWYISPLDNPPFSQISLLGRYLYTSKHM